MTRKLKPVENLKLTERIFQTDRRLTEAENENEPVELPASEWNCLVDLAHDEHDDDADMRTERIREVGAFLGVLRWELQRVKQGQEFRNPDVWLAMMVELDRYPGFHRGVTTQGEVEDMKARLGLEYQPPEPAVPAPKKRKMKVPAEPVQVDLEDAVEAAQ